MATKYQVLWEDGVRLIDGTSAARGDVIEAHYFGNPTYLVNVGAIEAAEKKKPFRAAEATAAEFEAKVQAAVDDALGEKAKEFKDLQAANDALRKENEALQAKIAKLAEEKKAGATKAP